MLSLVIGGFPPNSNRVEAAFVLPPDHTYDAANTHYEYKFNGVDENGGYTFFQDSTYKKYIDTFPKIGANPYPMTIKVGNNTWTLNYNIWKQKNLYVYGSYVSVPNNYFKCGYQIHSNLAVTQPYKYYNNGYFPFPKGAVCRGITQNADDEPQPHPDHCATRGEWKYLGYDVNGNPFSNMWMINVATVTTFAKRDWQQAPWDYPLNTKTGLKGISTYNETAYGESNIKIPDVITKTQAWIADTFNDMPNYKGIHTGTKAEFNQDVYKFLYIQSAPTTQMGGSGRMWHKLENGQYWYQTFSVPHLIKKEMLPVTLEISDLSLEKELPIDSSLDEQETTISFKLTSTLNDTKDGQQLFKDDAAKVVYYTRSELEKWHFTYNIGALNITNATVTAEANGTNKGTKRVEFKTKIKYLRGIQKDTKDGKYKLLVNASVYPTFKDKVKGNTANDDALAELTYKPLPPDDKYITNIPSLNIHNNVGEIAFDGVQFDDVSDSTDMSDVISKEVLVNGQSVPYDIFYSKNYVFPATTDKNGYFAEVHTIYTLDKNKITTVGMTDEEKEAIASKAVLKYLTVDWVYVYPTKPNAHFTISSNTWKENRIINISESSYNSNIKLVIDKYPITEYKWSFGGDTSQLHFGTNSDLQKQLQYSKEGVYSVTFECKNSLGKWSDPYTVEYQVFEDLAPNIEVNLNESVVTRNDTVQAWHYDVNSTDGDKVGSSKIQLWFDSDNDGIIDTKKGEWNGLGDNAISEITDFPSYTPTELGFYKYIIYATDEFEGVSGQDTLSQYISDDSKKSNRYEVEFWVDNYQPLSDLYIDTQIDRPNVDLFIMRDKDLPETSMDYLNQNRVNLENELLGKNIIPNISLWNMKTYEYSTPATTSVHTGSTYPNSTVPYSNNGYSGTLSLTKAVDNGYNYDFGYTASKQESRSASDTRSNYTYADYRYNGSSWSMTSWGSGSSVTDSVSYSSDGYSGTLSKTGASQTGSSGSAPSSPKSGDTYTTYTYWTAYYSGTVYKTTYYWVPDVRWVYDYTGQYSGTIYKYVRQPYTDPWRASSSKYVLYYSDNDISELTDFMTVLGKCDAKVILAGKTGIQSQYSNYAKFIDITNKTTKDVIDDALEYIAQETPGIEQIILTQNQNFTLNFGEEDLDNDNITEKELQFIHDKDYFDNPTGQESGSQTSLKDTGWTTTVKNSFANVGKFRILRRVKDAPTGAYGDSMAKYSGSTEVDVIVHRKPIAIATLDWDYDINTKTYKTTWIDLSYDLDHNISDSEKGIKKRKIMWRREGGEWNYSIPDNLTPGIYKLRYYVQDIENAWSDVFTIDINGKQDSNVSEVTFTLQDSPPMQFEAKLRSEKTEFRYPTSPVTLPASENLQLYEIWTRYPTNPNLTMGIYNSSGVQVTPTKTVYYSTSTGTKEGNDINWDNLLYNTPKTLLDGNYLFKISANSTQSKTITFPITISTPINLIGTVNSKTKDAEVNTGDINVFTFFTSSYVNSVQLTFEGKTYSSASAQISVASDNGKTKTWVCYIDIADGEYPDGRLGNAEFKASIPSGKSEVVYVNYKIVGIRASNFLITMMLDTNWRPYYFDLNNGVDQNHDGKYDSYPRRPNTDIGTLKLPVNYYSLVGFSQTYIKAGYKIKGKIDIQGNPDTAYFNAQYYVNKQRNSAKIPLSWNVGNEYLFEWIIPIKTDSKSFISFDLVTKKGSSTYGNEKWVDKWDARNSERQIFYVKGCATDDLMFIQNN